MKVAENPSKIMDLEQRVEELEAKVRVLYQRTMGLVKLGGPNAKVPFDC